MLIDILKYLITNNPDRVLLINILLSLFKNPYYLEIGVRRGETIISLKSKNKYGVDPNIQIEKNTIKKDELLKNITDIKLFNKTSDEFFVDNKEQYDVIFIDGLHLYDQVIKDIQNSLNFLNKNGIIVVHDCNPKSEIAASRDQCVGEWNGDVWKSVYDIKENYPELDYFVIDIDFGLGIITKKNYEIQYKGKIDNNIVNLKYEILEKDRKKILNLKNKYYLLLFIIKHKIKSWIK